MWGLFGSCCGEAPVGSVSLLWTFVSDHDISWSFPRTQSSLSECSRFRQSIGRSSAGLLLITPCEVVQVVVRFSPIEPLQFLLIGLPSADRIPIAPLEGNVVTASPLYMRSRCTSYMLACIRWDPDCRRVLRFPFTRETSTPHISDC